jgi:cytochrome c556
MKRILLSAVAAGVLVTGLGAGVVMAQDRESAVKDRREYMKSLGKQMAVIKDYTEGKADQSKAVQSAEELQSLIKDAAIKFPKGTSTQDFPGKSGAKPVIWSEPDRFKAASENAAGEIDKLVAAVKSGDKDKVAAQFQNTGKEGCGGCHTVFRQKLD